MDIEDWSEFDPLTASVEEIERHLERFTARWDTARWPSAEAAVIVKRHRRVIDAIRFRAGLIPPTDHTLEVQPSAVAVPGVYEFVVTGRNWILTSLFVLTCSPAVVADPDDPPFDQLPADLWGSGMQIVRPDDDGHWELTLTCHVPSEGVAIAAGDTARRQTAAAVIDVRA